MRNLIAYCILLISYLPLYSIQINEKGFWVGDTKKFDEFDCVLGKALANFFIEEQAYSVVDFGCGLGKYVKLFRKKELAAKGFDGNPNTPTLSGGMGEVLDLSESFQLPEMFDWVLSLEVGEHLPKQYEKIFIENLMRHARNGIILSWAIKNQGGMGHFNEQNNDYIKAIFASYGYINDLETEKKLRTLSTKPYYKKTIMVFRKPN